MASKHSVITLLPGEKVLRKATRVGGGNNNYRLGVSNLYDLYLVGAKSGDYTLVVYMKLQFFFKDSGQNRWAPGERKKFITNWEFAVKSAWGKRVLKTLSNGKKVKLRFQFKTQIGGWMWDHWEITVTKLAPNGYIRSSVARNLGNVALDSNDLKQSRVGCGTGQYTEATHEFGHMLGLRDEYKKSKITNFIHNLTNKHANDCQSIMNAGKTVRPRHDGTLLKYVNKWVP